jgi:hypothetical protein
MRIEGEPHVTVRLAINSGKSHSGARATTRLTRNEKGHVSAFIDIGSFQGTQELIAHELEHIIEQLDGVDLAARAALPRTGVTEVGQAGNMFETTRARRIGLKVVSELRR